MGGGEPSHDIVHSLVCQTFPRMGGGEPRTAELFPGESAQAGSLFYALAEVSLARAEYADLSVHVLKIFARRR